MPNSEQVLQIAREILEAEARVLHLKRNLEALLSGENASDRRAPLPPISRGMSEDSSNSKVLKFAREKQGEYLTAAIVATALGLDQIEASRALYRLGKKGELLTPQRGYYILPVAEEAKREEPAEAGS